jgi:hypothetical protein
VLFSELFAPAPATVKVRYAAALCGVRVHAHVACRRTSVRTALAAWCGGGGGGGGGGRAGGGGPGGGRAGGGGGGGGGPPPPPPPTHTHTHTLPRPPACRH